ncbi:hypothetical protein C8F04DRAFT_1093924 [Mycena alexandri]|uniref:Uncharacterized protein n=1 Tax=Mycena alexandri TaxID=1745969 RepID=A0AAD6X6E7_9AGAR|nr:hypothetical protein C8F04DRAFT_1103615 [Mycena alexandri]KAJ7036955.1 hypothetical protein C8F04DRAFT_1093924 [Mycena alexandri]
MNIRLLRIRVVTFALSRVSCNLALHLHPNLGGKGLVATREVSELIKTHLIGLQNSRLKLRFMLAVGSRSLTTAGFTTPEALGGLATEVADSTAEAVAGFVARGSDDAAAFTAAGESSGASSTDPNISLKGREGCKIPVSVPAARNRGSS